MTENKAIVAKWGELHKHAFRFGNSAILSARSEVLAELRKGKSAHSSAECLMELLKNIDEAKAEFPLNEDVLGVATEDLFEGDDVKMRPVNFDDVKEWFLKWFGEVKASDDRE
jgi:hypothetical protein